jgi:hypothetical protein
MKDCAPWSKQASKNPSIKGGLLFFSFSLSLSLFGGAGAKFMFAALRPQRPALSLNIYEVLYCCCVALTRIEFIEPRFQQPCRWTFESLCLNCLFTPARCHIPPHFSKHLAAAVCETWRLARGNCQLLRHFGVGQAQSCWNRRLSLAFVWLRTDLLVPLEHTSWKPWLSFSIDFSTGGFLLRGFSKVPWLGTMDFCQYKTTHVMRDTWAAHVLIFEFCIKAWF